MECLSVNASEDLARKITSILQIDPSEEFANTEDLLEAMSEAEKVTIVHGENSEDGEKQGTGEKQENGGKQRSNKDGRQRNGRIPHTRSLRSGACGGLKKQ